MRVPDEVRLFMWTHGTSRPDLGLPSLLVLLALGWVIEAIDDRYGSFLVGRSEANPQEGEVTP